MILSKHGDCRFGIPFNVLFPTLLKGAVVFPGKDKKAESQVPMILLRDLLSAAAPTRKLLRPEESLKSQSERSGLAEGRTCVSRHDDIISWLRFIFLATIAVNQQYLRRLVPPFL